MIVDTVSIEEKLLMSLSAARDYTELYLDGVGRGIYFDLCFM